MVLKISYKIFLAIIITALISIIALQQIQQLNFEKGLRRHSQLNRLERLQPVIQGLQTLYAKEGNWESLRGKETIPLRYLFALKQSDGGALGMGFNGKSTQLKELSEKGDNRKGNSRRWFANLGLLDSNKKWLAGAQVNRDSPSSRIMSDGKVVGYLALAPIKAFSRKEDKDFIEQQRLTRLWTSFIILIGASIFALLISRSLSKPIKKLNKHVQRLASGEYDRLIINGKSDELGSLSNNINSLADTLRKDQRRRQQWISDISHELRTPVSILKGELECIEDGLQPLNMKSITSLKSEVERLNLLINDLHQLSQSDSGTLTYDFQKFDIRDDVLQALESFQERFKQAGIETLTNLPELPLIEGDQLRLRQVFHNLLQNTLSYTDSPGQFAISGRISEGILTLIFEDSAPSVSEESIARLFERLYRVDPSRTRAISSNNTIGLSSSGLGLSICDAIIKAHNGRIYANKSELGGIAIIIELPVLNAPFVVRKEQES